LFATNHNTSDHALDTTGTPSMSRGALSWFHNASTYGGQIFNIEHFVIASSKFKIIGIFACSWILETLNESDLMKVI